MTHERARRWLVALLVALGWTVGAPLHAQEITGIAVGEGAPAVVVDTRAATLLPPDTSPSAPVWLRLRDLDDPSVDAATWPARVRAFVSTFPDVAAVELTLAGDDPQRAAFLIKLTAAEVKAARPAARLAISGAAFASSRRDAIATSDVVPSIDAYVVDAIAPEALADDVRWIESQDPGAVLVERVPALQASPRAFVTEELSRIGGASALRLYPVTESRLESTLAAAGRLRELYEGGASVDAAPDLTVRVAGSDGTPPLRTRVIRHLDTFVTWVALLPASDMPSRTAQPVTLTLRLPLSGDVVVRDPVVGSERQALRVERDDVRQVTTADVRLEGGGPWLVDFTKDAAAGFVERSDASASRTPSVEEIIARHQVRQAAERAASPRYVMNGRIQQYFRPTATDPGYDIVTENRFFVDREDGTEWEERDFRVNGARFGEPRPPMPLLQPEKVLALPLAIDLDARYRYSLSGTDTVRGRQAWVVTFEPQRRDQSLYRGTVWIDRETYARLRQHAVQTGLGAPVVSNDETQEFAPVAGVDGQEVWLPASLYNQQVLLIAGRTVMLERRVTFGDIEIAPDTFDAQRDTARAGVRTMYRETDAGVRYFVKEGDRRVVSDLATTRAKALALGVTLDPGFRFPLPIGGIQYLNFRFRGRPDTQVAVLFAGVLAAINVQRPKAIAGKIDASVDIFAMAPPGTDRVFGVAGRPGEIKEESLLTWNPSVGLNLGWQATSHHRVGLQSHLRFDGYVRDSTTAEGYVTPSSTATPGVGLTYEYRQGGYTLTAGGSWSHRLAWRPWGHPDALVDTSSSYAKYALTGTKVFYLGPVSKFVLNGAWYGGTKLDRFSQYQFGLFDETRLHGVPSAGVRYGELAMARGQYSFNLFEQYRLDLFVDRAWGRVRDEARIGVSPQPWEPLTGLGAAFNVRIPGRTLILRGEVGRSFLPSRFDGLGRTTLQVMVMKPL